MKSLIQYFTTTDASIDAQNAQMNGHVPGTNEQQARHMAEQICAGFRFHDRGQRTDSVDAFYAVDRNQFTHIDDDEAYEAARAYADALWAKDSIEKPYVADGQIDPDSVGDAEWEKVREPLVERAEIIGMDTAYADDTTTAWRRHKTQEDYWTPFLRAQLLEYRIALDDPDYPDKPNEGLSGFGPEPVRYALGVELHDMHSTERWEEAIQIMVPYYRRILRAHDSQV